MKKALVTGGNRGIGFEICRQLAAKGLQVFMGARDISAGEAAVAELENLGVELSAVQLDLLDRDSIEAVLESVGGELDVLVNNAGVLFQESILQGSLELFEKSWQVHVLGPLQLAQLFMPGMNARGYGRVVNVSSGWGSFAEGLGGPAPYSITKAALNAMTIKLAEEAVGDVRVNAICPGWVRTAMGGAQAPKTPQEGADTAVWLATTNSAASSGSFFRERHAINW